LPLYFLWPILKLAEHIDIELARLGINFRYQFCNRCYTSMAQ